MSKLIRSTETPVGPGFESLRAHSTPSNNSTNKHNTPTQSPTLFKTPILPEKPLKNPQHQPPSKNLTLNKNSKPENKTTTKPKTVKNKQKTTPHHNTTQNKKKRH